MTAPIKAIIHQYMQLSVEEYNILSSYRFKISGVRRLSVNVVFSFEGAPDEGILNFETSGVDKWEVHYESYVGIETKLVVMSTDDLEELVAEIPVEIMLRFTVGDDEMPVVEYVNEKSDWSVEYPIPDLFEPRNG